MKVKAKIKTILDERIVEVTGSDYTGPLRKKAFIAEICKPAQFDNKHFRPDTIGFDLVNDRIDEYQINVGEVYEIIYDSDTRIAANGSEVFTKNKVFRLTKAE